MRLKGWHLGMPVTLMMAGCGVQAVMTEPAPTLRPQGAEIFHVQQAPPPEACTASGRGQSNATLIRQGSAETSGRVRLAFNAEVSAGTPPSDLGVSGFAASGFVTLRDFEARQTYEGQVDGIAFEREDSVLIVGNLVDHRNVLGRFRATLIDADAPGSVSPADEFTYSASPDPTRTTLPGLTAFGVLTNGDFRVGTCPLPAP